MSRRVCASEDCAKWPSFGTAEQGKREFCAQHAKKGMVALTTRRLCAVRGCSKWPSFGAEGSKKREFCSRHAAKGLVPLTRKRECSHLGCSTWPSYGFEGSGKRERCATHAREGMIALTKKSDRCEDSPKAPRLGTTRAENKRGSSIDFNEDGATAPTASRYFQSIKVAEDRGLRARRDSEGYCDADRNNTGTACPANAGASPGIRGASLQYVRDAMGSDEPIKSESDPSPECTELGGGFLSSPEQWRRLSPPVSSGFTSSRTRELCTKLASR